MDDEKPRSAVPADPESARIRHLSARATRAGYRLECTGVPCDWELLELEDGTLIYSADTLDEIEKWLNE